jgi:hypothetical protein
MPKRRKSILIPLVTVAVLILAFAILFTQRKEKAVIEGKSGPYIEMGAQLNGLIRLEGDKVLVSSRKQGLYTFDPINGWKKIETTADLGEITSIVEVEGNVVISTKENKIIAFSKVDIADNKPIKIRTYKLSVPFQKIFNCEGKLVGISDDGVFDVNEEKITIYKNSDLIPQVIACHKDMMLVGTRANKILSCSITGKACESFAPKTGFVDIRGLLWSEQEQTWFASVYGSPSTMTNVIKLINNKWVPVGSHIGDVVGLYPNRSGQLRFALTESGYLYEYKGNNTLVKKGIEDVLSPYYAEVSPEKFYVISFGNLISYEKNTAKNHGTPILLEQVEEKQRSGNTYVWDVEVVDKDVAFSATSMIGVWWSSNGGTTWNPINNGLDDLKVHFIKYNKKHKVLVAGTHTKGLYTCGLPCKKWKYNLDPRFANADLQDAVDIDEDRYAIASEQGALIYNAEKNAIEKYIPLPCKYKFSSDLWTTATIGKDLFFGPYAGSNCPTGIWKLTADNKYENLFDINEPISGIVRYNDFYYIGTLKSMYKCRDSACTKTRDLMVNRMSLYDNILWVATSKGVGFLDLKKNDKKITWVLDIPSQVVKVLDSEKKILLVGTLDSGVLRIRLN